MATAIHTKLIIKTRYPAMNRAFFNGGDLNPGERHSRFTRGDSTVMLCALRAATVLSQKCCADFGRPLAKKVMSRSRDGPGVTGPSRTNIVPLTAAWNPPLPLPPPLKKSPNEIKCTKFLQCPAAACLPTLLHQIPANLASSASFA